MLNPPLGHVNTYVDPKSGQTYDYGVQIFSNISVLTNFFSHFNIPLVPVELSGGGVTKSVNFDTGIEVPASDLIGGNITAAWLEYASQQAKYPTIFKEWDLPDPVPEDLLMPFGDFLHKYDLKAMAYQAFQSDEGAGNILVSILIGKRVTRSTWSLHRVSPYLYLAFCLRHLLTLLSITLGSTDSVCFKVPGSSPDEKLSRDRISREQTSEQSRVI
jgi:hypothetical protein